MKIFSWNVNGIRAVIRKGFLDFLEEYQPDIICLQEIKISQEARAKEDFDFPGYTEYFNSAQRPGYSGTAILVRDRSKLEVTSPVLDGFGKDIFDSEGRIQVLELKDFYLINNYFPNANHELSRLQYKLDFNDYLLKNLKKLEKKKPVIVTGDLNVAHQEIDLARPRDNVGNPGFTNEERDWMSNFLKKGFIDTFREANPKKVQYTWWSYRFQARERNVGWRIDYFCVSAKLIKSVKNAYILDQVTGSDHCPVVIEIK